MHTDYLFTEKIDENSSQSALHFSKTLDDKTRFPLTQVLAGRRSRRFCMGANIPESPLAFKSNQKPFRHTQLEHDGCVHFNGRFNWMALTILPRKHNQCWRELARHLLQYIKGSSSLPKRRPLNSKWNPDRTKPLNHFLFIKFSAELYRLLSQLV